LVEAEFALQEADKSTTAQKVIVQLSGSSLSRCNSAEIRLATDGWTLERALSDAAAEAKRQIEAGNAKVVVEIAKRPQSVPQGHTTKAELDRQGTLQSQASKSSQVSKTSHVSKTSEVSRASQAKNGMNKLNMAEVNGGTISAESSSRGIAVVTGATTDLQSPKSVASIDSKTSRRSMISSNSEEKYRALLDVLNSECREKILAHHIKGLEEMVNCDDKEKEAKRTELIKSLKSVDRDDISIVDVQNFFLLNSLLAEARRALIRGENPLEKLGSVSDAKAVLEAECAKALVNEAMERRKSVTSMSSSCSGRAQRMADAATFRADLNQASRMSSEEHQRSLPKMTTPTSAASPQSLNQEKNMVFSTSSLPQQVQMQTQMNMEGASNMRVSVSTQMDATAANQYLSNKNDSLILEPAQAEMAQRIGTHDTVLQTWTTSNVNNNLINPNQSMHLKRYATTSVMPATTAVSQIEFGSSGNRMGSAAYPSYFASTVTSVSGANQMGYGDRVLTREERERILAALGVNPLTSVHESPDAALLTAIRNEYQLRGLGGMSPVDPILMAQRTQTPVRNPAVSSVAGSPSKSQNLISKHSSKGALNYSESVHTSNSQTSQNVGISGTPQ